MKKLIIVFCLFLIPVIQRAQKVFLKSSEPKTFIYIQTYDYSQTPVNEMVGIDSGYYSNSGGDLLVVYGQPDRREVSRMITSAEIKENKKKVLLQRVPFLPAKTENIRFIKVLNTSFNVSKKNYNIRFYDSFSDYKKQAPMHSSVAESDLIVNNSIFDELLNKFLSKHNYLDTTGKFTLSDVNRVLLEVTINSITENSFGKYKNMELAGEIEIVNPLTEQGGKIYNFNVSGNIKVDVGTKQLKQEMFEEGLESAIINLSNDKALQEEFVNAEQSYKEIMAAWDVLKIDNTNVGEVSVTNAVNSVVTVKTKKGHGSGCVLSRNGYIVTNNHVIGVQKDNIEILIGSSVIKTTVKVVRRNPMYDLALLKADTVFTDCLVVDESPVSVGADVYCIGTPKDIELGQSISKGIISSKRKLDGKMYLQSDVSVNRGNSGGALINKDGKLIGIINAKLFGLGIEGVGFAIPINVLSLALKLDLNK